MKTTQEHISATRNIRDRGRYHGGITLSDISTVTGIVMDALVGIIERQDKIINLLHQQLPIPPSTTPKL